MDCAESNTVIAHPQHIQLPQLNQVIFMDFLEILVAHIININYPFAKNHAVFPELLCSLACFLGHLKSFFLFSIVRPELQIMRSVQERNKKGGT